MANSTMSEVSFIFLLLLCISTSFIVRKSNALKMRLIHRDSPESPLHRPNLTESDRIKELVRISHVRIHSLANRVKARSNATSSPHHGLNDIPMRPMLTLQNSLYLAQVGMGTFDDIPPPLFRNLYLALDTGSDLTWTQCEGCDPCFHQTYPYYPASISHSYKPIPCSACASVGGQCNQDRCEFTRSYGDGSSVKAIAAQETFVFPTSLPGEFAGLSNVVFGCGYSMNNFNSYGEENQISGLLGMSYGDISLVERGAVATQGRFSYCLQPPSVAGKGPTQMFIRWGSDVIEKPGMKTTPMPRQPHPLYYLNLEGISVGLERLNIPPDVFKIRPDGSGGCVIDSGAGFSLIATEAYAVFEKTLNKFVLQNNKNLRKMKPELGLHICFERYKDPETVYLPLVTFHFENNADFVIKPDGGFTIGISEKGSPMVCSNILDSTDEYHRMTLIGAIQQVNHRIIYDTKNQQLMFREEDCAQGTG